MNKKVIYLVALAFSFLCIGYLSCNKDTIPNQFQRLLGKWQEVQYATDDNNNGVLDQSELHNVDNSFLKYILFNNDSTGLESITVNDSLTTYPFTWLLLQNDSLQRNGVGHDTTIYKMVKISALSMTLETMTNHGLAWYIYNKK